MKIAIIGAEGQVGTFLRSQLSARHEVIGTSLLGVDNLPQLDMCDRLAVQKMFDVEKPDYVILTAAMTHVDRCEELPEAAEQINVLGTQNIAQACRRIGAGLAYFSTDYVFDGLNGPYCETDAPNPISVYGRTKLEGEKIVQAEVENHLIIRPMFIFSYLPGSMNFFMQVAERVKKHEPITAPDDQLGHPVHADNLAAALGELIDQKCTGTYHLAGLTRVSKAEWAKQIVARLGGDPESVKCISTVEFNQKAPRPLNSGLITEKAQQVLSKGCLWTLDQALQRAVGDLQGTQD